MATAGIPARSACEKFAARRRPRRSSSTRHPARRNASATGISATIPTAPAPQRRRSAGARGDTVAPRATSAATIRSTPQPKPQAGTGPPRAEELRQVVVPPTAAELHPRVAPGGFPGVDLEEDAGVVVQAAPEAEIEGQPLGMPVGTEEGQHRFEFLHRPVVEAVVGQERAGVGQGLRRLAAQRDQAADEGDRAGDVEVDARAAQLRQQPLHDLLRRPVAAAEVEARAAQQPQHRPLRLFLAEAVEGASVEVGEGRDRLAAARHRRRVIRHDRQLLRVQQRAQVAVQPRLAARPQLLHAPEEPVAHAVIEREGGEERADDPQVPDADRAVVQSQFCQSGERQVDHLGVGGGATRAEQFHARLGELARAPRLRLLVAEDRPVIAVALRQWAALPLRHERAHDRGGEFRAEGDLPVAVVERIHLRRPLFARFAEEEFGRLDDRRVDRLVAVRGEAPLQRGDHPLAERALGGPQIRHAAKTLDHGLLFLPCPRPAMGPGHRSTPTDKKTPTALSVRWGILRA